MPSSPQVPRKGRVQHGRIIQGGQGGGFLFLYHRIRLEEPTDSVFMGATTGTGDLALCRVKEWDLRDQGASQGFQVGHSEYRKGIGGQ